MKYVATLTTIVTLVHPVTNEDVDDVIFTYMLYRGWFGRRKCKFNERVYRKDLGLYVLTFASKGTNLYKTVVLPWLNGDNTILVKYYKDKDQEIPESVQQDANYGR
jgi:hypothetical protein